jgi:hypothetical protein
MPLPTLPFTIEDEENAEAIEQGLLMREGVRDFGPRRASGWRTLKR